jgi:uncharacterized membrane protein YccC
VRAAGGDSLSDSVVRTSVAALIRDAARLDRTQSDPVVAARNALGVAAPLVIGTLAGQAVFGLPSTIGALQTGFADRPGPYRLRMLRMFGTALVAALTGTLAVVASRNNAASVVLLLVLGFIAGLLLAGGPSATQVGVAGVAAALVIGHIARSPGAAWHVGLLILAGGAGQTVLAIAAWPLGRHRPERAALAGLYRELAAAARAARAGDVAPPADATLIAVRQTLYGLGHDHGPSVEAYRVLLDEAERVRREIAVVAGIAQRLDEDGDARHAAQVRRALAAASAVLDELAAALAAGREVHAGVLDAARTTLRATTADLTDGAPPDALTRYAAAGRLRALSGQLRAAVESSSAGASEGSHGDQPDGPWTRLLRDPLAILRANLNVQSAVFRHAVRLAVLVAGSDLVVRLADFGRGYWVPLTLLVVLRPDFAATFQRAVMRALGTIVGVLIATALVHWIPGGDWWRVALIAVLAFGMRLAGPGNVALSAVCLSGLVVVLLEINGVPARSSIADRALDTLVGGGLAVLAALALPAWERRYVPSRLAELLAAYRRYVDVVADLAADRPTLQRARAACRLARTNAQASVERARSEPVRGQASVELGRTVLAHSHRFIYAMLSVESVRLELRKAGGVSQLVDLLAAAGDLLDVAGQAVRANEPPGPVPALRPRQVQLADLLLADPARVGGLETATTLADATDRITNSVDTLLAELRRQLPLPGRPS